MPKKKFLGTPAPLEQGTLPTKLDIYNHALYIRKVMESEGSWKQNTKIFEVVKRVSEDIKNQWDKTDIPTFFETEPEKAERKVREVLKSGKNLTKTPVSRRSEGFASEMNYLLDLAVCSHDSTESCICPAVKKVILGKP